MTDIERFFAECTTKEPIGWVAIRIAHEAYQRWAVANGAELFKRKAFIVGASKVAPFRQRNGAQGDRFEGVKMKGQYWPRKGWSSPKLLDNSPDSW